MISLPCKTFCLVIFILFLKKMNKTQSDANRKEKNDFKLLYNTGFTCSNSKRDERILKWFAVNVRLYYVHWNKRRAQAFVCWFAFVRAEKIRYTTYSLSFPPLYSKYIEYSESPHRLFLNERTLRFDILTVSAMNAKEK